jgi:ABC-2 type transport system ATP-binding protein
VLVASGLIKRYGDRNALDGFDLTVSAGEITGLVGHNGAGKTTFVEIVTGLVRPDSGRVTVGGIDAVADSRRARRLIGVAPQEQALYVTATVHDNLRLFGALAGLRRARLRQAIENVAADLRLSEVLGQRVGLLSGGQRRRTQAAAALIGEPRLLLLDEPTAGADPETRQALLAAVRARAAAGVAVVYTTHYLPELADLGATLAVARAGRVIARGSQQSLMLGLPGELRLQLEDSAAAGQACDSTGGRVDDEAYRERDGLVPVLSNGVACALADNTAAAPVAASTAVAGTVAAGTVAAGTVAVATVAAGTVAAGRCPLPPELARRARTVDGELRISSADPPADLAAVLAAGCTPVSVDVRKPDLDDLYRSIAAEVARAA